MRTRMLALALLLSASVAGVVTAAGRNMSYIYRRGDVGFTRISGAGISHIGAVSKKYGGEFVWVRVDGRNYLIRDAATLAEVRNAFREVEAMDPTIRDVERRLKPFEQRMEDIEERLDAISDIDDDEDENLSDSQRDELERKMRDAERDMREVEQQMKPIERELERLERESERREKIAEDRFERIVERAIGSGIAERVK
jgi:hypothetical protein